MILHRGLRSAAALAVALVAVHGTSVHAQYGYYPGGYGGWGGWGGGGGGTVAGDAARGMGAFAAGAGYYNLNTAQARSINTQTQMQWDNYMWQSTAAAAHRERLRNAQRQATTEEARQQILARLRDNPEQRDVYSGDALNVAKEEIDRPNVYTRTLKAAKAKIGGGVIRNIPFQYASAGIITSVHDLVANGPPPLLKDARFASDRAALKDVGAEARKDLEEGKAPDPEDLKKIRELVKAARTKLETDVPRNTPGYDDALKYLKSVAGLTHMLEGPALDTILAGAENRPDATLAELLEFMNAFSLRFGPAKTPEQRQIYDSLYQKLVAVRSEVSPSGYTPPTKAPDHATAAEFFGKMQPKDVEEIPPPPKPPAPK